MSLAVGVAALVAVGCTAGDDSSIETTAGRTAIELTTSPTPPGFETLPPVPQFTFATDSSAVVAQVSSSSSSGLVIPVFTLYGDGTVITASDDAWVTGTLSAFEMQDYLAEAQSVGLLDAPLAFRAPGAEGPPDIVATFAVDDRSIDHAIDVARVDESSGLWRFLLVSAARNVFDLTETFQPVAWVECDDAECALVDTPAGSEARPVLRHEDPDDVLAAVDNP